MKLQFLIPQYKEDEQILSPLLKSIALQQAVDFNEIGVIIVNDGSDIKLSEQFLHSFPFEIKYFQNPHKGVSAARNRCLDEATADYVMFCDADDMFYNMCGVWLIMNEINIGFDTLVSYFTEQIRLADGTFTYVDHKMDATFVHGKVFRRQFLIDNDIRWCEDYTIHEDSFFNYLAQACCAEGQLKLQQVPFYMWRWNGNSVCRHDDKYILKTFNQLLDSSSGLVYELVKRGKITNACEIVTTRVYDSYFTLNKKEWLEWKNQEYRKAVESRFKKFFVEFKKYYDKTDEAVKRNIIINLKNQKYNEGMIMESITFNDWIDFILSNY